MCRLAAKDLSTNVKPILDKNNIRFVGIGFDSKHVKSFVKENFFEGELFIDIERKCYAALQFKRITLKDILKSTLTAKWRHAISRACKMKLGGDLKGDGYQNGGALVVDKKGKLLYEYVQTDVTEHVSAEDIFNALEL